MIMWIATPSCFVRFRGLPLQCIIARGIAIYFPILISEEVFEFDAEFRMNATSF